MKLGTKSTSDRMWRPTREVEMDDPLRWRKPGRVRVVEDLFADCDDEQIDRVFAVMALAPHLTFQVLTKRADRMRGYLERASGRIADTIIRVRRARGDKGVVVPLPHVRPGARWWPLPNVWLGVSVEDQAAADERIPELLATPAAVRFLSVEPLLGPVKLSEWLYGRTRHHLRADVEGMLRNRDFSGLQDSDGHPYHRERAEAELTKLRDTGVKYVPVGGDCDAFDPQSGCPGHRQPMIDWVIVGGESGPGARPCDLAWIRSVVEQCRAAGVPCFVKQLGAMAGEWDRVPCEPPYPTELGYRTAQSPGDGYCLVWPPKGPPFWHKSKLLRLRDRKGGDPREWSHDLRVREFPNA